MIVYKYFDYNGYIDYNDPDIPFLVGFSYGNGNLIMDDLDKARNMLVSGVTGSGKSVFLHSLIVSFLCNSHCNVFLVDDNGCEFSLYKKWCNVSSEAFGENSLGAYTVFLLEKMEERFNHIKASNIHPFSEFINRFPDEKRYVLVIDDLAFITQDKKTKDILTPRLLRIAQIGYAIGFHLIISTQRPDHTIMDTTLRNSLQTRVAFHTVSKADSQLIIDQPGAERLAGNGAALYRRNGIFQPDHVQTMLITSSEIAELQ